MCLLDHCHVVFFFQIDEVAWFFTAFVLSISEAKIAATSMFKTLLSLFGGETCRLHTIVRRAKENLRLRNLFLVHNAKIPD